MVLNFIGSKRTLGSRIVEAIKKEWPDISNCTLCDAFSGTGALSVAMAPHVNALIVNDWENFSVAVLHAQFNAPPNPTPLIDALNTLTPITGAITNTYSELGGRLYFTTINAQKIDAVRLALRAPTYSEQQRNYLRGALVSSADTVANVASVYGAYLKDIKASATNLLNLKIINPAAKKAQIFQRDAQQLCIDPEIITPDTIIYLDPPYNQRQYGANYFPLNAIADIYADTLTVAGITGIPSDGYNKSVWCSRKTASSALKTIVEKTPARRIALSYNQEGILTHEMITAIFTEFDWSVRRAEIPYKRFASQKDLESNVTEYLFLASRN